MGGDPVLAGAAGVGDRFSLTLNALGFGADGYLVILGGQVRRGDFASEPGGRELRAPFEIEAGWHLPGIDESCGRLRTQIYPDMLDAMRRSAFEDCRDRGAAPSGMGGGVRQTERALTRSHRQAASSVGARHTDAPPAPTSPSRVTHILAG